MTLEKWTYVCMYAVVPGDSGPFFFPVDASVNYGLATGLTTTKTLAGGG